MVRSSLLPQAPGPDLQLGCSNLRHDESQPIVSEGSRQGKRYDCEASNIFILELKQFLGAFCGSSFLNHRFKEQVEERLKEETYLSSIPNSKPVEKLIQAVVTEFELSIKREFTGTEVGEGGEGTEAGGDLPYTWVTIPGLRKNQEKGFASGDMAVTRYLIHTPVAINVNLN
jgi:hypothetical protein